MKKIIGKIVTLLLVVTLGVSAGVAGTLAYLQDEDSDVNVMTLGNVHIAQHEYQRELNVDGTYKTDTIDNVTSYVLEEFEQNKPLYPIVGDPSTGDAGWDETIVRMTQVDSYGYMQVFAGNNAQDKFVVVENTGNSDAYVRTFVAVEVGEADPSLVGTSYHSTWKKNELGLIEVDGNKYYVYEYVYLGGQLSNGSWRHENGVLPANDRTYPNLSQVYLKSIATNEDMEKLDGNKNGTLDIIVLSQAIQAEGFANAVAAFDAGFPIGDNNINLASWLGGTLVPDVDTWDGTVDTSFYNDADTEFVITTAEQLAGFGKLVDNGNTFEGKTVKLGKNIDLKCLDNNGEAICFDPIGSYRFDMYFKGTFDGQGYSVINLSQNTWALNNGYYYNDCGLGLFGAVEDGTVKNLVVDAASVSGESALCGIVAAAVHNTTFENITVKNSNVADYQYYAGGVVGWASGVTTFTNCNIDASTTVGSQWGDFGNANGGVIGGMSSSAAITIKDSVIACRIDATNDVVSAYQWYNYRNSGMLVGRAPQTITNGEVQTVATPNVTCENVTVVYGDWANYTYCEFAGTGYPFVRVQAGVSVDGYSNVRYGHPTDADGNTVVDDNHRHNDGEAHHELIEFNQLFGGPAEHRYCYYGIATHPGVTVIYNNK